VIHRFSLENEARAYGDEPPFSNPALTSIQLVDGTRYNMSVPAERRSALDNSFAVWANTAVAAVTAVDPQALVTAGMFTYYAVGHASPVPPGPTGGDPRFPPNPAHLSRHTALSYLDIHVYPTGSGFDLDADLLSEDFQNIDQRHVPVLMGEFGAFKRPYSTTVAAADELRAVMLHSCRMYGFQGWLAWTWDTFEQDWMLWTLEDEGGFIGAALSPRNDSDACFTGGL